MAKWEIIEDITFKKQAGGKTSASKTEPKFKRKGKNNLNSTVEEEPKNTVQVNQNGQIIEYDPSSPEYKKLYESGTLTSYDPKTDAYITPPLKEFIVVGEKPEWAKEKENNQSKYSKDWYIDNYLPKFSRNMGISANNMNPNDVERYNRIINDKTVEDIFKRYPTFDSDYANDRLGTLKKFSPKEVELIKNSSYASAIEPNIWDEFKQAGSSAAVKLLTSQVPGPSFPNPYINKNLTYEEAQEASSPLNLLAPLAIPYNMTLGNAYTQQQGEKNYSLGKALKGQKPIYNSTALSIAGDPLNLLGLGLFKGLVSAGKIAKLEDAYQLVKGLGKEEALSKLKSLISLDNISKNSFTPMLDNVGVEAFGASKQNIGSSAESVLTDYPSFKQVTNAPENIDAKHLAGLIKKETDWLRSPEYLKRKMEATGRTAASIKKEAEEIINNINNTPIEYTEATSGAEGVYTPTEGVKVYNGGVDNPYYEGVLDHEVKHAFSESAYQSDHVTDYFKNTGYTNYPKVNLNTSLKDRVSSAIGMHWANLAPEQQVVGRRMMDVIENTQGVKRGTQLNDSNVENLIEYLRKNKSNNNDMFEIAWKFKNKFGDNYKTHLKNFLNKAYGTVPYVIPTAIGVKAASALQQKKHGGIIEDPMGQWAHPGSITKIPSNQITMQGVNYPVLGVSDRGHTQMMYPGEDYSFRGKSVTEYPMMGSGGEVNFTYAGENHRVYEKVSPTGNGKGIEGHIMVNHPTENKGKWDTIDLTKITNGKVKTVAQGVASTKKWHKENPEYANGGRISSWEIIEDTPQFQKGGKTKKSNWQIIEY
jgi:hypothetical protein